MLNKDVQYGDIHMISKSLKYFAASVAFVSNSLARDKLMGLASNVSLILYKCTLPIKNYSSVCHADCWNNNLVFKYQVSKRPVDCLLADFQLARINGVVDHFFERNYSLYNVLNQ
ncbi:unnamed protein product [Parnassius mnemosyne]|uniref:Uncharacterized protein n=1 Tax=Parnassius mnemosyne TaxID=213953 RepID=A0AAV1KEI0_9NEOP